MKVSRLEYLVIGVVFTLAIFMLSFFSNKLSTLGKEQVALVSEIGASVTETPMNKLAADLRDYSKSLDDRERSISVREQLLQEEENRVANRVRNILIGTTSLAIITLLLLNLYIRLRERKNAESDAHMPSRYADPAVHVSRNSFSINLHNVK